MLIERDNDTTETIGYEDFCVAVAAKMAAGASVWDCRDELYRLNNNKGVLLDRLHGDLASLWGRDEPFVATSTAVIAFDEQNYAPERGFRIRFVFWEEQQNINERNPVFLYDDVPHDHNFELLTVNHAGPGYRTSVWEYDSAGVIGYVGEKIAMTSRGQFNLAPRTMLWLQQNRDIHMQHSPDAASISLNLISWVDPQPRQYFFDVEQQRIRYLVPRLPRRREPLFQLAAVLGDANTLDLLSELIARRTLDPDLQRAAIAAATRIYESTYVRGTGQ